MKKFLHQPHTLHYNDFNFEKLSANSKASLFLGFIAFETFLYLLLSLPQL